MAGCLSVNASVIDDGTQSDLNYLITLQNRLVEVTQGVNAIIRGDRKGISSKEANSDERNTIVYTLIQNVHNDIRFRNPDQRNQIIADIARSTRPEGQEHKKHAIIAAVACMVAGSADVAGAVQVYVQKLDNAILGSFAHSIKALSHEQVNQMLIKVNFRDVYDLYVAMPSLLAGEVTAKLRQAALSGPRNAQGSQSGIPSSPAGSPPPPPPPPPPSPASNRAVPPPPPLPPHRLSSPSPSKAGVGAKKQPSSANGGDGRNQLLDQIRGGVTLRSAADIKLPDKPKASGTDDIGASLRKKFKNVRLDNDSDEDDSSDDSSDDGWDDESSGKSKHHKPSVKPVSVTVGLGVRSSSPADAKTGTLIKGHQPASVVMVPTLEALIAKCPAFNLSNTRYASATRADAIGSAFTEGSISKAEVEWFINYLKSQESNHGLLIANLNKVIRN